MSDHSPPPSPVQGSDDDATIPALAALIRRGDPYLLAKRPAHKRHGGLWEFPGGKLEPGEAWLEAARRELREELGVRVVRVGEPVFRRRDPASSFEIVFVEVEIEGEPEPLEHEEIRWIPAASSQMMQPSSRLGGPRVRRLAKLAFLTPS